MRCQKILAPIVIVSDVFVGANSIILKGVTIGERSISAEAALLPKIYGQMISGPVILQNL